MVYIIWFILCLIWFILYGLYYVLKYQIYSMIKANTWTYSHKNATSFVAKINSLEEINNYKQTHKPVDFSLERRKTH